jgi:UDP-glucose 6-dehydrogenase
VEGKSLGEQKMKHVIVGSGVIGQATGTFLECHGEDVIYIDTDIKVREKLKAKGKDVDEFPPAFYDILWICTHEDHVLDLIPTPSKPIDNDLDRLCGTNITVIRSTIPPSTVEKIKHPNVLHMPEFLREAVPLEGVFFPDRVIIGSKDIDSRITRVFKNFISDLHIENPIIFPMMVTSLIKIVSNVWLATQIGFWNEIYHTFPNELAQYKQTIANYVSEDHRISKYGTILMGNSFSGACLPKDLDHLITYTNSPFFKTVRERNNEWKKDVR